MKFDTGDLVILNSFRGARMPQGKIRAAENYWKLIGKIGAVAKMEHQSNLPRHERGERVLVTFNDDVAALGLSCHNEIHSSLWIFISDLRHVTDR
jgi:hypothetical protein